MDELPVVAGLPGYLALPHHEGPGVVVVHDGFGFLPHLRGVCDDLGAAGFVAFAPDLSDGGAALPRTSAVVDALREHPVVSPDRVAAVGFSRGGATALQLAASGRIEAVVSYYALVDVARLAAIACPVLALFAERDHWEPPDAPVQFLAGLRRVGTTVDDVTYPDTAHSFANADVPSYADWAAEAALARAISFLRLHLT